MFAIEVNCLTGRYVATAYNDRRQSEWPPHPARLFSALVAALHEPAEPDPGERQALEWLEAQPPPAIAASSATPRTAASHFVPVNDTSVTGLSTQEKKAAKLDDLLKKHQSALEESGGEVTKSIEKLRRSIEKERDVSSQVNNVGNTPPGTALALFPDQRGKQERTFPSMTPDEPRVTFQWDSQPPSDVSETLDGLLSRVTRLGHSSSLVSCRVVRESRSPNWIPSTANASQVLRTTKSGQLAVLERQFLSHEGIKPRSLPFVSVRYRDETEAPKVSAQTPATAGDWIVFEFDHQSRAFPSTRTEEVAKAMRSSILKYADDPIPEGLSGHSLDGVPSTTPHVGFVPLPYVGSEYADGRLLGIALSVPRSLNKEALKALYRSIGKWERAGDSEQLRLLFGSKGIIKMRRMTAPSTILSLRPGVWRRPERLWASATPMALPKHPGRLSKGTPAARSKAWKAAEQAVVDSCKHVGLPEPAAVEVSFTPFIPGARSASRYPVFKQSGNSKQLRLLIHAFITFDTPVTGPLLIGAGRYLGLGLMRPIRETPEKEPAQ